MTSSFMLPVASVLMAMLVAWLVPAFAMRMLMPSLESSPRKVRNYRGVEVTGGLGIVWLVWAVVMVVAAVKALLLAQAGTPAVPAILDPWPVWSIPALLVSLAFAFGLIDDVFGGSDTKGFRGHLTAMLHGRLTTGGLKLVGIGCAAALAAFLGRVLTMSLDSAFEPAWIASWVLATLTIALAANLVNLTDLRPGRSLKTYCLLVAAAMPYLALNVFVREGASLSAWAIIVTTAVLVLGPVAAIWRYDLGEHGMLGDAGANAMGALAGYLFATSLPLLGLVVSTGLLLALNLASERISFSTVIEGNAALRWFDALGRVSLPATQPVAAHDGEQADGGSAALSDTDDVAVADTRKDGAQ